MKVVVIGAGGFVGRQVAEILGQRPGIDRLLLVDRVAPKRRGPGIEALQGDISDPAIRARICEGADAVICLAAILGGAAEADYALARRVNLDATLDLAEALRDANPATRFVFASTIAAYGKPMPDPVTDATPLAPSMVYGAQKVMMEVALSNFAARGWLDALSLRPSGVMARDGADAALRTAFLSRLFWCIRRGEDITLPVPETGRTWLTSVRNVAQNFVHGALLPDPGPVRAFTLPALSLTFAELVEALQRRFPDSRARVRFAPDPELTALFASYPRLVTETADRLGFARDADADALVRDAMIEEEEIA
ncbi:NAD-dependent epimerase/dehydratase family protein [Pseudooceanicola sp. CBS1P-1]|uniref:NAD-dependent epimerase/dehydratase family protein n=1 Tax=Pseudooceanicola albus TaxID=2692189 RepID=A0A6L7GCE6_9RHOB|nr:MULTISPECIES: NAD-dependent epimerase/dehydratase family protein [Pseudooceanicola]MBT9386796.1 NAD-dependent epimerase/dehydratase family protein [Pseudooceanicola endophyticus]MXN20946.1 NAD-dependent epimerase/dehydratase family protein [Pseudooceanicola albus]